MIQEVENVTLHNYLPGRTPQYVILIEKLYVIEYNIKEKEKKITLNMFMNEETIEMYLHNPHFE